MRRFVERIVRNFVVRLPELLVLMNVDGLLVRSEEVRVRLLESR